MRSICLAVAIVLNTVSFLNGQVTPKTPGWFEFDVPALAVNENIRGVSLGALARAMFDQQNVTGTINGTFRLGGRGFAGRD